MEDPTPQIPGFDSVRPDRDGSGIGQRWGGGFIVFFFRQGAQYSVPSCATTNPMDLQKVIIHLARRRQFSITSVYIPLHLSGYSPNHQNDQSLLDHFQEVPGLVCGDFNAHHSSWDDYVSTYLRGSNIRDRVEAHSKFVLIDGSPTRAASGDQCALISMPDVSLVDTVMAHRFSWETIPEFGSYHIPLLLIWDKDIKVKYIHTRRRPNYPKADWPLFHKCLDDSIHAVLSVGFLSKRLEAFCSLLKGPSQSPSPLRPCAQKKCLG